MRTYSCTHSNIDIITKLATTQNLPQIKITSFDGNALEWLNFVVQFKEIVHDQPNLSGSQCMTYLRQCLANDAKKHDWFIPWLVWICNWFKAPKATLWATIVHCYCSHWKCGSRIEDWHWWTDGVILQYQWLYHSITKVELQLRRIFLDSPKASLTATTYTTSFKMVRTRLDNEIMDRGRI